MHSSGTTGMLPVGTHVVTLRAVGRDRTNLPIWTLANEDGRYVHTVRRGDLDPALVGRRYRIVLDEDRYVDVLNANGGRDLILVSLVSIKAIE